MPTRVIIGGGTAAAVFLSTMPDDGFDTVVVGEDGLWAELLDHPMGQPEHLLHHPGEKVPPHKTPSGKSEHGLEDFLSSRKYQAKVEKVVNKHRYGYEPKRKVQKITKTAMKDEPPLVVWFDDSHALGADQVILAAGIGTQSGPPKIEGTPLTNLGYSQIIEGISFLGKSSEQTPKIDRCVYGGGATSAWVAAVAALHSPRMCWLARKGGSEFSGSVLPGDRNHMIMDLTEKHKLRRLEAIEKIKVSKTGKLKIYIKDEDFYYVADQFIYSLGGNLDVWSIDIQKELVGDLRAFKDKSGALGAVGEGVLAWATPTKSLMIVGAQTYNFKSPDVPKQNAPMKDLPWNAQVPDGIAVAVSTISALNNYIPVKQKVDLSKRDEKGWVAVKITENSTNINLADRNQLAVLFTLMFDEWPAKNVNELVEAVVEARSKTDKSKQKIDKSSVEVFGITPRDLFEVINTKAPKQLTRQEFLERVHLVGLQLG